MICGVNKKIGVEVPQQGGQEAKVVGGLRQPVHRVALVPLKVVFGAYDHQYDAGTTVYVNAAHITNGVWAKEIFELDGKKFCLLPEEFITLIEFNDK